MSYLGSISGRGVLRSGADEIGSVDYQISVYRSGSLNEARGVLSGESKALFSAFDAGSTTLALEDGSEITVLVTNYSPGQPTADCVISGPVPGF